jgi:DNA-binding protein H-NS
MPATNIGRMSIEELLKLRDDVRHELDRKAESLSNQLARFDGGTAPARRARGSTLRGRKVPIKFRDRSGNAWAGRGAMPVWLRDKIKAGAKLQDFAVDKQTARPAVKRRKKRRAKR